MAAKPISKEDYLVLQKYFIAADEMRQTFNNAVAKSTAKDAWANLELLTYMRLWYGLLYVTIEGWLSLGIQDGQVENCLKEKNS